MKRSQYILVLLVVFTGYLFPQSEDNKNIVIREDTTIAKKVVEDTVVIEKPVSIKKETDLSKYHFYNDYLDYLKKNNLDYLVTKSSTVDMLAEKGCKKTGIVSARIGTGFLIPVAYSLTLDIPIDCKLNITFRYFNVTGRMEVTSRGSCFGLGIGSVSTRTDKFILKFNICPAISFDKKNEVCLNLGADMLFNIISINPDIIIGQGGFTGIISLGLNIVY